MTSKITDIESLWQAQPATPVAMSVAALDQRGRDLEARIRRGLALCWLVWGAGIMVAAWLVLQPTLSGRIAGTLMLLVSSLIFADFYMRDRRAGWPGTAGASPLIQVERRRLQAERRQRSAPWLLLQLWLGLTTGFLAYDALWARSEIVGSVAAATLAAALAAPLWLRANRRRLKAIDQALADLDAAAA